MRSFKPFIIALILLVFVVGGGFLLSELYQTGSIEKEGPQSEKRESEETPLAHKEEVDSPQVSDEDDEIKSQSSQDEQEQESFSVQDLEEFESLPISEKEALIKHTQNLKRFANLDSTTDALVEHLRGLDLHPIVKLDSNPYTGSMSVVRTRDVLPGTRYFHAQFFESENGEDLLQHMSFEFRPTDDSFNAAKKTVQSMLELNPMPSIDRDDYVMWKSGEYIVWIKKLNEADLKDDPFNAYSLEDVGTVRVAVELEIHDHHSPSFHMPRNSD